MFFLYYFVVLWSCQVSASLLDPSLISKKLQNFARDALGVEEMQIYLDKLQFNRQTITGQDVLPSLAVKLADKLKTRFAVAQRLKKAVEDSYNGAANPNPATECCKAEKTRLKYDVRFRSLVDVNNFCAQISSTASPNPVHLDESVLLEMKAIAKTYPFIKWQYFGSEEGMLTAFPVYFNENDCSKYDPRYRPFYVETATPEAKDVVLIIDTSASMIGEKLVIAREAANTVLDTMNPKDHVGIVSFNTKVTTPGIYGGKTTCYNQRLALATPENIDCLRSYVGGLVSYGKTNYRMAFEKAFQLLKETASENANKQVRKVILFLTDGAPSDEKRAIFQTIRDRNLELNNSVVILTFGFGGVDQETINILQDIALQNTAKYGAPSNASFGDVTKGKYIAVEDIKTLRSKMGSYYNFFATGRELDRPVVSVPYVDAFGTGLLMSITLPCYHKGKFIGVAGTDINIEDLVSDIDLLKEGQIAYAFMTSKSGRTIFHPLLPAPTDVYGDPVYLDIRTLEPEAEFNDVFISMKTGRSGSKTFVAKRFLPRGGDVREGVEERKVNSTYSWTQVEGTEFTLGVVVPVAYAKEKLKAATIPKGYKFQYHRIDLQSFEKPCSHFGVNGTKDTSAVKFAPGAFKDTFEYIGKRESRADLQLLNAYMTDETGTIESPGLKPGIRDTVTATWKVEDIWLREKTELTQYLAWRYIGTADGVFRLMPGAVAQKSYDPRQRPWYYSALGNTGLVTLTTPYLHAGQPNGRGAGVVITVARSLYRGESSHHHHTNDEVFGVMGADFSLTYFYRLLTEVYPKCRERNIYSCFVMDSAGFLIMHEDFLAHSEKAQDLEYVHITNKEKNIAEHLITNGYLKKRECRNLKEIQKQSFYEVDLPDGGVDVLKSGDSCSKYQLNKIVGTNAYLGVTLRDSLCAAESCTCSSDNKCFRSSTKCECPCTSDLEFNYCRSQFPNSSLPICPPPAPLLQLPNILTPPDSGKKCHDPRASLEKCFDPRCSDRNSSRTCEGIVSCYWCVYNKDSVPLKKPYCAAAEACFRGKEAQGLPLCVAPIKSTKESLAKSGDRFSRLSIGALAGIITSVCVAGVVLIAAISVVVRRRFLFSRTPSTDREPDNGPNVTERPPAPLPIFPAEYVPDDSYEDLDSLDRSREGSVISLEWPSPYNEIRVRSTNKPLMIAAVRPPTQSLPPSSDRTKKHPFIITGGQLSQIKEITASNLPAAYQPQSPTSRDIPHALESDETKKACDNYSTQLHDNEPSEVPENQSSSFKNRSSHEHPTLTTKNPLYEETFTSSDQKLKGNWSPYDNLPPPPLEPRKDADVYMSPLTLPQRPISGLLTPETSDASECYDEHGYLKCVASNRFDLQ